MKLFFPVGLMLNESTRGIVEAARYAVISAISKEMNLVIERGLSQDGQVQVITLECDLPTMGKVISVITGLGIVKFNVRGETKEEVDAICELAGFNITNSMTFTHPEEQKTETPPVELVSGEGASQ